MMKKAIFIDRDGVINVDYGYVHEIDRWEFIPRSLEALKKISENGLYKIIIVTNQSGIGRGYFSFEDYKKFENYLFGIFEKERIKISKIYTCPHKPEDRCECRKPKIKFLIDAQKEFDIDLDKSFVIGDKTVDIKTGKDAGCKTILVMTGKKGKDRTYNIKPDFIAKDLYNAVELILK